MIVFVPEGEGVTWVCGSLESCTWRVIVSAFIWGFVDTSVIQAFIGAMSFVQPYKIATWVVSIWNLKSGMESI